MAPVARRVAGTSQGDVEVILIVVALVALLVVEIRGALSARKGDTISELWWGIRDRAGGVGRVVLDVALLVALVVAWVHLTLHWP
jgi:hypothetical protein